MWVRSERFQARRGQALFGSVSVLSPSTLRRSVHPLEAEEQNVHAAPARTNAVNSERGSNTTWYKSLKPGRTSRNTSVTRVLGGHIS
eukprot:1790022-Prymnesium_polylepis.1